MQDWQCIFGASNRWARDHNSPDWQVLYPAQASVSQRTVLSGPETFRQLLSWPGKLIKFACSSRGVLDGAEDDWESAWSRVADQDEAEENKARCFLAMLFKADSIGRFELTQSNPFLHPCSQPS